jgi:hypothetical protein
MLDQRAVLIAAIPAAGLVLGLGLWLAFGREAFAARTDDLEARLSSISPAGAAGQANSFVAASLTRPIFALTTGPGAVAEPTLRLDGISRTPSRKAALISINGKPPQWLEVGATVEDVAVLSLSGGGAEVETLIGGRHLKIGQTSGPPAAPSTDAQISAQDQIPPGFRSPPPPASAPALGG